MPSSEQQHPYGSSGFLHLYATGQAELIDCTLSRCYAGTRGGALFLVGGTAILLNVRFIDCTAGLYGGGMLIQGDTTVANLTGCSFLRCSASDAGGAIMVSDGAKLHAHNTDFRRVFFFLLR